MTMADEALQTSRHDHSYQNSNLRQRPVTFVSAGTSQPLEILDELLEVKEDPSSNVPAASPVDSASTEKDPVRGVEEVDDSGDEENEEGDEGELIGPEEPEAAIQTENIVEENAIFFFDVKGDPSQAKTNKERMQIPDRSLSRSSTSSEEVILFKGRDTARRGQTTTEISMTQMRTEIQVVEEQIASGPNILSTRPQRKKKTRSKPRRKGPRQNEDEDADLADYIANMLENGDADDILGHMASNRRDLGGLIISFPMIQVLAKTTRRASMGAMMTMQPAQVVKSAKRHSRS